MSNQQILGAEHLEVLKVFQGNVSQDAIIAGGATRDLVMGKPFRDIDIWYNHTKVATTWAKLWEYQLPRELSFGEDDYIEVVNGDSSGAGGNFNPTTMYLVKLHYKGVDYDLIGLRENPIGFLKKNFDVGFSKVWHDGKNLIETDEFKFDKENKLFTLDATNWTKKNFAYVKTKRIPRLLEKYPDFKENIIGDLKKLEKPSKPTLLDAHHVVLVADGWEDGLGVPVFYNERLGGWTYATT